jgi:hypothetical protein
MSYRIDPQKVAGVITETNRAIEGKGFNEGEVMIGLAELLGRIAVSAGSGPTQIDNIKDVIVDHILRTIRIGSFATEKSNILPG